MPEAGGVPGAGTLRPRRYHERHGWATEVRGMILGCALLGCAGTGAGAEIDDAQPVPVSSCPHRVTTTLLAGSGADIARAAAVDAWGNVYVTGQTLSTDFPVTAAAFDRSHNGIWDAFVAKLDPGGAVVYATFLGGSLNDSGQAIAVDGAGNATVTGGTSSSNFPATAGAFDPTYNGGAEDGFVTSLDASGSALVYSTFLGGSSNDFLNAVVVDGVGGAHVAGGSTSANYPTTPGAYSRTIRGGDDAVVTTLAPSGASLSASTYVGGSGGEAAWGLALDPAGNACVAGQTLSRDFPVTPGAFQRTHGGGTSDAFVVRISPSGTTLVFGIYLGGSSNEDIWDIAADAAGALIAIARVDSPDYPVTPGAYDVTFNGGRDVAVTKLDPGGSSLVFSTYLGGGGWDEARGLAVTAIGAVWATGHTDSVNFPVTVDACRKQLAGSTDAFMARLSPDGARLGYASYLGSAVDDGAVAIHVGPAGGVWLAGVRSSDAFASAFR